MKLVILVLVVVVLLFGASVWLGARRSDSPHQSTNPDWAQNLRKRFGGPDHEIGSGEITSECYQNGTFRISTTRPCTAEVAASKQYIRNLRLALAGVKFQRPGKQQPVQIDRARKAQVTINSKGGAAVPMRIPLDVNNDSTPALKVLREGATLSLECKSAVTQVCEVELM